MSSNSNPGSLDVINLRVTNIKAACKVLASNVKHFINIIRTLNYTNNTEIQFSDQGMKYYAEESQFFQGTAFIKKSFFDHYKFIPQETDVISFGLDLSKFTEFLSAFIDNDLANLKIICYGDDKPMAFILTQTDTLETKPTEKDDQDTELGATFIDVTARDVAEVADESIEESVGIILTEYVMQTKDSINPIEFQNMDAAVLNAFVINAKAFQEVLQDFDKTIQEIQLSVRQHSLSLKSIGIIQNSTAIKMIYDINIFYKHEIFKTTKNVYKFTCFKALIKAMQAATKICLETLSNGVLRIQMMMRTANEVENEVFLEFHIAPSIYDEDDDEDENDKNNEQEQDND